MGALREFVRKVLKNGYTGALDEELDEIRSEYPRTLESGYHAWATGSTVKTSLLAVPSAKVFHLKHLMINNEDDSTNLAFFYDGPGTSVPVGGVHVNGSTTVFVNNFKGWIFQSAVHASLATSLTQIRVGGLIRDSD
ncbi:MAG: hypothetical protein JRD89_00630 [Deltaproteobacteria bacterium]|nr:hypothetical protein [Deltaproteobacteria bacterium]